MHGRKEPSYVSSSRASALRGASWFSHSALSTYCEAEGDGERFANGAGGRHDTVKVEEGRGSQRATVVKCMSEYSIGFYHYFNLHNSITNTFTPY